MTGINCEVSLAEYTKRMSAVVASSMFTESLNRALSSKSTILSILFTILPILHGCPITNYGEKVNSIVVPFPGAEEISNSAPASSARLRIFFNPLPALASAASSKPRPSSRILISKLLKSFEKTRIKELGQIFPEYQDKLEKLNSMIFDLMYLLKSNNNMYQGLGFKEKDAKMFNYYNKDLNGSFSIKKVLPIFTELTYEGMPIGNGSDAMYTYANEEQLKLKQKELTKYCQQDTWAMVEILWGLKKEILEDE